MWAKTKNMLLAKYRKIYGTRQETILVYQFPKGHWSYATPNSEVGQSLQATGYIYPEINCKAQQWELVELQ